MPQNVYSKLYPSGSSPGKFYGTAKTHKLLTNNIDDLLLRHLMSNIAKAANQTPKIRFFIQILMLTSEHF